MRLPDVKIPKDEDAAAYCRSKLADLDEYLRTPAAQRSVQGYVSGVRLATSLRMELHSLEAAAADAGTGDPTAEWTDDECVAALIASVAELPDSVIDQLDAAIHLRRTGRPLLRVGAD